jgi:hypothetical protein
MSVRCKEMTERLKIIEDQAIEAIDDGLNQPVQASRRDAGESGLLKKAEKAAAGCRAGGAACAQRRRFGAGAR